MGAKHTQYVVLKYNWIGWNCLVADAVTVQYGVSSTTLLECEVKYGVYFGCNMYLEFNTDLVLT